jgi:alkylation response protein AidB-like acyl-CoA dehydrogenase
VANGSGIVGAAERDRDRAFSYERCAAFCASGFLGLMVPREYRGYGGNFAKLMRVVIAISGGAGYPDPGFPGSSAVLG